MEWARILAYITGTVDQELLLRNEYLVAENRILLSGPNVIMPSERMRWVWDSTEANQSPDFTSEKAAQRILDLLIRHANDIAVTLTQFPQYYEPLFLERDHKGRTVSIVDEW
jgi:uncharacterized protein